MADQDQIQPEGTAPEGTTSAEPAEASTPLSGEGFGDDLNLDTPAEPSTDQAGEAEAAPSGGDGTLGTEPPATEPTVDTPAETAPESGQGESATVPEGETVSASDSAPASGEPAESAGDEAPTSPEPSSEGEPGGSPEDAEAPTEPSAAPEALTSEPLAAGPGGPGVLDAEAAKQEEGAAPSDATDGSEPAPEVADRPSQDSAQQPVEAPEEAASADLPAQDPEAAAAQQKAGEQDKPPAQIAWEAQYANSSLPPPESSDCISDGSIPQASGNDAPTSSAVAGGDTVMGPIPEALPASTQADTSTTATPSPEATDKPEAVGKDGGEAALAVSPTGDAATLFGGRAGPSPLPEVADKDLLPHPALSAQSPGFISGTTQETQTALPVPGEATQAEGVAAVLSGTASGAEVDAGAAAGQGVAAAEATASEAGAAGTEATAALPVAASVPETFRTLSDDGKAIVEALGKIQDSIGDVIALEFKTLANVASHISKRLDETKHKLTEPEQRTKLITVGNQVLELLESLESLFGEAASDAPLPPGVEEVLKGLGDLGESARKSLYA